MVVLSKCISFVYCMMGMTWLVQTTRFSDIPPQFNMSHYTITEPGNRASSRWTVAGHTTRFEGAMLSTLYHSRL